jgi:hypothetical protein
VGRGGGLAGAALLLLTLGAGPAAAGVADQVGATFGLILPEFVAAFPPVEALVVAVEGDRLYLDLTESQGAQVGQELTVYRKGDVFRHPVTGQPLGRFEEVLGSARIERVLPRFSEARFVAAPDKPPPRPEDGARITRGRIRAAVTPAVDLTGKAADLRRVPFMIALGLDQSRRFQASDPSAVQELLLGQRVRPEELLARPERAVALGRTLQISVWVVPLLLERRGVTYLDVTWISAVTGQALLSRRASLVRTEAVTDQRFPWEPLPQD